jgi:hypothetical protein
MSKPQPSPYIANLIEEQAYALEGLAEILNLTGRPDQARELRECAVKLTAAAREVRSSAPQGGTRAP